MTYPSGALIPTAAPNKTEIAFRAPGRFRINGRCMSIHAYRQHGSREWVVSGTNYVGKPVLVTTWEASLTQEDAIARACGLVGSPRGRKPRRDVAADRMVTVRFTDDEIGLIQRVAREGESLAATVRRLALSIE